MTGSLALRGKELSGEIEAASPRLAVTGTGRIALTPQARRRAVVPLPRQLARSRTCGCSCRSLSPFTTAVASGSIRVVGELANVDHLLVDATVDTLDMRLFDYALKNAGADPRSRSTSTSVKVEQLQLVGEDTRLRLAGTVGLRDRADRAAGRRATRTSASCRASSATCAARAAPS